MRIAAPIAIIACLFAVAVAASTPEPIAKKAVYAEIEKIAALLSDGRSETSEDSLSFAETIVGDGPERTRHVVALFSMFGFHGGNGQVQYLAVFQRNFKSDPGDYDWRPIQLLSIIEVGQDYERRFEKVRVSGDRVTLEGMRWVNDAHCCPSMPTSATFRVERFRIVELSPVEK